MKTINSSIQKMFTSNIVVFITIIVSIFVQKTAQHIIGGSINTDLGIIDHGSSIPQSSWLKAAMSNTVQSFPSVHVLKRRRARKNRLESQSTSYDLPEDFLTYLSMPSSKSEESFVDDFEKNPFFRLRGKRQSEDKENCRVPSDFPSRIRELNSFLNSRQVVGLLEDTSSRRQPPLPRAQPSTCPAPKGDWWPRQEFNLRTSCPWIYEDVDLGDKYYPRFVRQAKCLCTTCINADTMGCRKLKRQVSVFKRTGCRDGLAVMEQTKISITVGCVCLNAIAPSMRHPKPTVPESWFSQYLTY